MTTEQNDFQGGHTPLTPPPASGPQDAAPQAATPQTPAGPPAGGRSSGTTAIMVLTAVVGGIALLGSGGAAAAAAAGSIRSSSTPDSVQTVSIEGVTGIDVSADASSMRVEYGDVDEARLAITNGRGSAWTFERDDDELIVRSPQGVWGWWFGSWFGDEEVAVLTLPESLQGEGLDADLTLNAGSLDVVGEFGSLAIDVNAGALDVEGSSPRVEVNMNAGRADILLDDVDEADLGVSAGDLNVELTGAAPSRTSVEVNAGSLDLTVPDVEYSITKEVSAGSLDAKVEQSSSARRTIEVSLSAGSVTIRPGR
jgi:hypothetical protein